MNNAVFGKAMENVRKYRYKTCENRRRNHLVSEPNFGTTTFFPENLLAIEMRKAEILMNKPVHLGLSILELSKILMYEFWYDYVKIYGEKAKLCYVDTDSIVVYIKRDDIYKDIAKDVETRFNTSDYKSDRQLPKTKSKKVIRLMKDELDRKIMTKFDG